MRQSRAYYSLQPILAWVLHNFLSPETLRCTSTGTAYSSDSRDDIRGSPVSPGRLRSYTMGQNSSSQKKRPEDDKERTMDDWRLAVAQGNEKTLIHLLQSPQALSLLTAVIDEKTKRTALHVASLRGKHHCVDRLLAAGASVKTKDAVGQTALMLASSRGHDECVGSLLKAGSSTNVVDPDGQSPLHLACGWKGKTAVLCSKRLIEHGAYVDAQGRHTARITSRDMSVFTFVLIYRLQWLGIPSLGLS